MMKTLLLYAALFATGVCWDDLGLAVVSLADVAQAASKTQITEATP